MNSFHEGWYLIYTKPRHEKKVHAQLIERKIRSFLPTKKILRAWGDRKKYVEEPLFPSYVFVYLVNMQVYFAAIDVQGALSYVRIGKEIVRVRESVVDNIKLVTDKGTGLEVSDNYFQTGRKLVINQGALMGLSCEIVQYNSERKILVRVDLLQRNLVLSIPENYLISA